METIKPKDTVNYFDNKEFQGKFFLQPDLEQINSNDFRHFDKNFAMTNLKHNAKLNINEPEEMRSILRGLHVLNNEKHYDEVVKDVLVGHDKIIRNEGKKDEYVVMIPVYEQRKVKINKFPKTLHSLTAEVISFVNCAAARNGHRIDKAITNKLVKEETISQKTDMPNRWGFKQK